MNTKKNLSNLREAFKCGLSPSEAKEYAELPTDFLLRPPPVFPGGQEVKKSMRNIFRTDSYNFWGWQGFARIRNRLPYPPIVCRIIFQSMRVAGCCRSSFELSVESYERHAAAFLEEYKEMQNWLKSDLPGGRGG